MTDTCEKRHYNIVLKLFITNKVQDKYNLTEKISTSHDSYPAVITFSINRELSVLEAIVS